ncbi:glypican-6 isoform X2 [Odontomachus brunneus]|uniref:glypican-6 isoform X2 n=1 Tax=Odontomachus brunneus TaxID=486640 RepID=UPI0013F252C5|nr:glypican-6 isoform X2 [Odontomachus brunneus]
MQRLRQEYTFPAKELKVCGSASSGGEVCCSADMELRLQARARDSHEKTTKETLHKMHQILNARANRFHTFFKDLLSTSKRGFHDMFKKTYGILYEQNAYVFTDFFQELENYYAKGTVDLDDALDNFFNILYQKMFTVLNSQYTFDNKYLECVSDHMKEMRPFGDVPPKLSVQIKRSFVATRAFSQALTVAANVLKNMQTLKPSTDCAAALTKMTACPYCIGIPNNVVACNDMCTNVMKGCLAQHAALDAEWNHFVDAVDKIADRLIGPFNIEVLVRPINLKISEAIMNFQENSQDVSQRVFTGCGRPVLGKRKRRDNRELQLESLNFDQETLTDDRAQAVALMDKLVKEIRQRVRDSKQFWVYLPYRLCNNGMGMGQSNTKECWNGTHIDKYRYPVASDGESQKNNAEVRSVGPRSTIVRDQLYALTTITNRLKSAFNGQDVDWIDTEETFYGSGSGSGDGAFTDDEDGFNESSGYGPAEPEPPKQPPPVVHEVETPPRMNIEPKTVGASNANNQTTVDGANGASRQKMSLNRALTTYLLPIVMMWFGGCLTEWL